MYIVKNMTCHSIVISDLRAEIRPGKVEDLDRLGPRYRVDESKDLHIAIKRGALKVIKKDDPSRPSSLTEAPIIIQEQDNETVLKQMQEMEKRIVERVNAQVQKAEATPQQLSPDAVDALQEAIKALQGMSGGKTTANTKDDYVAPEELPNDMAVDIHSRTIDRLTKGSSGQIKQQESKGHSNVDRNIDELEGLL